MEWAANLAGPFDIDTSNWWVALISAAGVGFLLGALPVGAAEAVALAAGAIPSLHLRVSVIVAFTAGHVFGKALWYWLGTLEAHVTWPRLRAWIDRARALAAKHPRIGLGVTAASAVASIPPFHLIAIAAGLMRTSPALFLGVSFAGRLLRFGLLAAFPSLLRSMIS